MSAYRIKFSKRSDENFFIFRAGARGGRGDGGEEENREGARRRRTETSPGDSAI